MRKQNKGTRKVARRDFMVGMMLGSAGGWVGSSASRGQAEQVSGNDQGATREHAAPAQPLVPWVFVHSPLEHWLTNYQRTFDAWADGGVRGIVVGHLRFYKNQIPESEELFQALGGNSAAVTLPTFQVDPKVYKSFGVTPPSGTATDPVKAKQLQAMLDNAAARGWEVLLFGTGQQGGSRPLEEDPFNAVGHAASVQDALNAFPQVHGLVMDGPGEQSYELSFHHGGELFEISEGEKRMLAVLGKDTGRMERGISHLRDRFHHIDASMVRYYSPGGMLGGLALFDLDENTLYWLRTRQETTVQYMAALRQQIDKLSRKIRVGAIPRTAAFSLLTTLDYRKMNPYFDYIFPKDYYWNRGFDGMYGTVARWVRQIAEWNPGLSERDCFAMVKSCLGLELPDIHSVADMDAVGYPEAFFREVVYRETRRALDAIGDDNKVIAWVSTGRRPHSGDPMTSHDLYRILEASQRAGLKRFIFHPQVDLSAAEWDIISGMCGKRWNEDPSGYWPSDTDKPDSFNGARKPRNRQ